MQKGLESDMHHRSHGGQGLSHLVKQRLGIKVILGPEPLVFEFAPQDFCNFKLPRLQAAIEYLKSKGGPKLCALSNNFSLARMLAPMWDGCVSCSDDEYREWFEQSRMPVFSWSSQARGFLTDMASLEDLSNEEMTRSWYSDENFARKERAEILAKEKGVLPINIALAYVLCQPFPTFALVGPQRRSEITSTMTALDIELSPQELAWLDLRAATPHG